MAASGQVGHSLVLAYPEDEYEDPDDPAWDMTPGMFDLPRGYKARRRQFREFCAEMTPRDPGRW